MKYSLKQQSDRDKDIPTISKTKSKKSGLLKNNK